MKLISFIPWLLLIFSWTHVSSQTVIPNGDFEIWLNHGGYQNPQFWDTDNKTAHSIPLFGKTVVSKDADHTSGDYSAKLETKHITFMPFDVPGILTLGTLSIDLLAGTYSLTGGVPIHDVPTHLKGFYKYMPQGDDSCIIAIGLSRTVNGVRDSLALGYFATKHTASFWTPFSAYIQYDTAAAPDSFNILIISSAVQSPTAGTILYVDQLTLDYSLGVDNEDPYIGIGIFQDRENREMIVYFDFSKPQQTFLRFYNMMGQKVAEIPPGMIQQKRISFSYSGFPDGCFILTIVHDNKVVSRKFLSF